ncbi:MAG: hypothetical protein NTY15_15945 [Planctomycetota bacterium]|nr:hypothetical protein [Planctomycetota bacterium]
MAKKSKLSDLGASNKAPPASPPSPNRQPRIVGWLVLIAGGVSTWYWYKPLPDSVHQTVNSASAASWTASDSGPKSLWSDQGLVVPGTSGVFENPVDFQSGNSNAQVTEANLVGTPKVTLVPWSDTQLDIREVLKKEADALPAGRIESNFTAEPPPSLPPATSPALSSLEATISKPSWPDEGYVPPPKAKRRNQAQITAPIPPFLETGMKSIRTTESDDNSSARDANQPNAEQQSATAPAPNRQPQFIRQPKR